MPAQARPVPLARSLPDDVVAGGDHFWTRYRRYPVFSARWFAGRTLLFGSVILACSVLTLLAMILSPATWLGALTAAGYTFVAFLVMTGAGPACATAVRHLRLPLRAERIAVVVAVSLGIVVAYFADRWVNVEINAFMATQMGEPAYDLDAMRAHYETGAPRRWIVVTKVLTLGGIYVMLGGGMALRAYFGEQRRVAESRHRSEVAALQARMRESDLRLGALQAQVEPHFLFNTLASVRALVRQDAARAEATLDALVDYLRATIPRLREGSAILHSTLGEQIDLCAHYLELMRLRTGDRLRYRIEVDSALREAPYPPLLLITLVENAVKHGVEPKPGASCIRLRAWASAGLLHVCVADDGVGLQPGVGGGTGLANVRDQLAMRFGTRASLRLTAAPGGGVLAEIQVPTDAAA